MIKKPEIRYYDGKEENGIIYNWELVRKLYNSLKIPKHLYNTSLVPCDKCKYNIIVSERSIGKTTNILLLGLCLRALYDGVQIGYIRKSDSQVKQKEMQTLFNTINNYDNGRYIKTLTDGKYNHVKFYQHAFYFTTVDNGKEIDKAGKPFMLVLTLDKNYDYKSSLQVPTMDFILFDEFLDNREINDESFLFFDLVKTIVRDRYSPVIFMSANNLNPYNTHFLNMDIQDDVLKVRRGACVILESEKGTKIYFEKVEVKNNHVKQKSNSLFFGFNTEKIGSIVGGSDWAFDNAPHMAKADDKEILANNVYFENISTYRIDCARYKSLNKLVLEIHRADIPLHLDGSLYYSDSVIFVNDVEYIKDERYLLNTGNIASENIRRAYNRGLCYFDNNFTMASFKNFFKLK